MKKRTLASLAAVTLALSTVSTVFASTGGSGSSIIMFGNNTSRTHKNTVNDKYPWMNESFIKSVQYNGKTISMKGNSTAIGAGNIMVYPISAPNDNPNGQGYLTFWDMSNWSKTKVSGFYQPKLLKVVPITGVSNSSPVYNQATNSVYLAAGGKVYKFTINGTQVTEAGTADISVKGGGVYQNQVVSYPLYVTAAQSGLPKDSLWVSSQNGDLFAIDPSNMKPLGHFDIGSRLDASPSLVQSTGGKNFIAVTSAYNSKNSNSAGTLFTIDPISGSVEKLPSYYTGVPSVSSPVYIGKGEVLWNDINGDVLEAQIHDNGVPYGNRKTNSKANVGAGQTAMDSEGGYSKSANEYIEPFTNGKGGFGFVQLGSNDQLQYGYDVGFKGMETPDGSPVISGINNLYASDTVGGFDQLIPNNKGLYQYGTGIHLPAIFPIPGQPNLPNTTVPDQWIPAFHLHLTSQLTTPSELMLGSFIGGTVPTFTLATNGGLELWANNGEYLTFGSDYTSGSTTKFTQPLTVNMPAGNLPNSNSLVWGQLISTPVPDQLDFAIKVNGGSWMTDVAHDPTYSGGSPVSSINLSPSTLDTWLSTYKSKDSGVWSTSKQNKVYIKAYVPATGNDFTYDFEGSNVVDSTHQAAVTTVTFNPIYTPPSASSASSQSQNSSLIVPQWMMAKYFPNIVPSVPSSDHSLFNLTVPRQTGMNARLTPSGLINFSLISPNKSSLPAWLYSSNAKLMNDTTDKEVSLYHLSNSFAEEGDALAVKANSDVFNTQLAKWLSGNETPYSVIGSTNQGSVDSNTTSNKSVNLQYNINSGQQFIYSETRWYNTKNGTVYYTWSGPATETDTPSNYDVKVQFDHYVAKPSVKPNTYSSQKDTSGNGFAWYSNQTNGFNVDPNVPMFYNSPDGANHLAYAAGARMRQVKPVTYNTLQYVGVDIKPHTQGASVATNMQARALQSRLGDGTSSGVIYKGSATTSSVQTKGQLVDRSYVLDVGNAGAKKAWGDSSYSAQSIADQFLKSAGATQSGSSWSMPVNLVGRLKIGGTFYGKDTATKTLSQVGKTQEIDYNLNIVGGQLVSVNGQSPSKLPSNVQDALKRMDISTSNNVFNTFEHQAGSSLTDSTLASIGNQVTGSSAYKVGSGWYNEGSKSLTLREYVTTWNLPSWTFSDRIPMSIPGLQETVNKNQLFTQGKQLFVDYSISTKNNASMEYDSSSSKPFGGSKTVTGVIPNATTLDSYTG